MKKLFVYSFFICFLLTLMFSCSKQESVQPTANNEKAEMAALMVALDNYNAVYFQDKAPFSLQLQMPTRSGRSWWSKFKKVLRADAYGALCGLLYGGWGAISNAAISSALACIELDAITLVPTLPNPPHFSNGGLSPNGGIVGFIDDEYENQTPHYNINFALENTVYVSQITNCVDSVGYYHNKILWQLNSNNLISIDEDSIDTMISAICLQAEELDDNGRNGTTIAQLLHGVQFGIYMKPP